MVSDIKLNVNLVILLHLALFAFVLVKCDAQFGSNSTETEGVRLERNQTSDLSVSVEGRDNRTSETTDHGMGLNREGRESDALVHEADMDNGIDIFPSNNSLYMSSTTASPLILDLSSEFEEIILDEIQDMRELALGTLMKIFGLSTLNTPREESSRIAGPPPEFMIDLYNTITDSYGVTRARNPFNAHVVRSYMEQDNSLNDFFYFNINASSIGSTETVLEAELHVHRMRTPHENLHPSLYLTPFYILSLYQVLDPKYLAVPDLHKLLGVHYVPALGSGWEVFNVKQAVMEWTSGVRANHGFLVAATSLGGDRVPVRFSRRGETLHSKQPILVLFNEDSEMESIFPKPTIAPVPVPRIKPKQENDNITSSTSMDNENEDLPNSPASSLENPRFHHALLFKDSIRHPNSVNRFRSRRSKNQTESRDSAGPTLNTTSCGKRDLLVNFEAIGWSSWIISPKGYNAFYCDGPCRFPLGQQVKPTNHATVQSIVHELKLAESVQRPCCVPTALLPISLLYYDDHDNVVLKQYVDMVAESCGCH